MVWGEVLMLMSDEHKMIFDYHKHNLIYIGDYIKFADTKAGVALSLNIVLIGFLGMESRDIGFKNMSIENVGMYLSLILLIVSAILFIWKILWPRYSKDTSLYMSWGGMGAFSSANDYLNRISSKSITDFINDMANQNYELAKVASKKYHNLKLGFSFLSAGAIIGLISWFFG